MLNTSMLQDSSTNMEWCAQEFERFSCDDKRLLARLKQIALAKLSQPTSSLNTAMGSWACAKAAYRFFNNGKV
jgi:hypothetical protein